MSIVDDRRIFRIAEAIRRGYSYEKIHQITMIDPWFIDKIAILCRDGDTSENRRTYS